ncbi:MAG: hypothetical protein ABIG39_03040 [Candidatus Micrarchaeota archaeon]
MMRDIGYWDALAWGSLFMLFVLVAYILLRRKGERGTEEFLCGESFEYKTPAHHFFFGFERTLEPLFRAVRRFHSEIINEYVAWLLIFSLLTFIALGLMVILEVNVV